MMALKPGFLKYLHYKWIDLHDTLTLRIFTLRQIKHGVTCIC